MQQTQRPMNHAETTWIDRFPKFVSTPTLAETLHRWSI
jgi:hypothetical protein